MRLGSLSVALTLQLLCVLLLLLPVSASQLVNLTTDGQLQHVTFNTKSGQIQVNLPAQAIGGDTISGSIFFAPQGKDEKQKEKSETDLNTYSLALGDQSFETSAGEFTVTVPQKASSINCILKDKHGSIIEKQAINLSDKAESSNPDTCSFPLLMQCGTQFVCSGPFDGDFKHVILQVDSKDLVKLAESPRMLIVEGPIDTVGAKEIQVVTPTFVVKSPINCIKAEITLADQQIDRDRVTMATILVHGLKGLSEPVQLLIENTTPKVAAMEGGDTQTVSMKPGSGWQFQRNIRGLKRGPFCIATWVVPPSPIPNHTVEKGNSVWLSHTGKQ